MWLQVILLGIILVGLWINNPRFSKTMVILSASSFLLAILITFTVGLSAFIFGTFLLLIVM